MKPLEKSDWAGPAGPVVLVIMDGVANGKHPEGDAVRSAHTPHLDWLRKNTPTRELRAHGTAVGLPADDDMGNSEVGHNAIGAGRVFDQGAKLVNQAIESGALWQGEVWRRIVDNCVSSSSTLHLAGLLSDGNVHSHLDHIKALLARASEEGISRLRVHILLDGRDVPPTSALAYVDELEALLKSLNDAGPVDFKIASGGGRMCITMDRYNANWAMVEEGWKVHVQGEGRPFSSARQAIETYRAENPDVIDQDLPAFVVSDGERAIGTIEDGDSVVLFNFRGDRAIEISRAFEEDEFHEFARGRRPDVEFAGMMQYDGDLLIPNQFLVSPPAIKSTMGEHLAATGIRVLAISETQKFGHVTYFFNGNRSGKFDAQSEEYVEIRSDIVPFEQRPWMKAAEITDRVVEAIEQNTFRFIRLNYPNGDMVGHTGDFQATIISVESVDLSLGRLMRAIKAVNGVLVVSADHGNADEMLEHDSTTGDVRKDEITGRPLIKTSHSLNPVPVHIYDPSGSIPITLNTDEGLGISSLAATCIRLLGFEPPEGYDPGVIQIR